LIQIHQYLLMQKLWMKQTKTSFHHGQTDHNPWYAHEMIHLEKQILELLD
jgi:hypothetical protein